MRSTHPPLSALKVACARENVQQYDKAVGMYRTSINTAKSSVRTPYTDIKCAGDSPQEESMDYL